MKKVNIFIICALLLTLYVFCAPAFAEEVSGPETPEVPEDTDMSEDITVDSWASEVAELLANREYGNVNIIYTDDSVIKTGVSSSICVDALLQQVLLNVELNIPMGYVVYDDPETEHIDGIRLNGDTVSSYKIPIDPAYDIDYELTVRTVYAGGFTGALAQMSDGTYDWTQLLENPMGLIMALYYVLATVSVAGSVIMMWRGKGKKVKSTAEIAKSVSDTAHNAAIQTIETQVMPIVSSFQNTAQSLVKAFALTTSKSKEAPSALLDVLQMVANTDASSAIEQAKALITEQRNAADAKRQALVEDLNNIANTIQEVPSNAAEQPEKPEEDDVAIF